MFFSPISYVEPVFRPPSEHSSLIFQATIGCSWNRCAFCGMYSTKKFRVKDEEKLFKEIRKASGYYKNVRKIFLADGNAFVLSADKLLRILEEINKHFPRLQRVSAYALPKDIASKSAGELKQIYNAGLKLLYIGIESGDDAVLKMVDKSETYNTTVDGLIKADRKSTRLNSSHYS